MARPERRRLATIVEVRRDPQTCHVCEETLAVSAHVAWTVGRGRLHEECIADARLIVAADRPSRRMAPVRISHLLLQRTRLCASCLAMALEVSLQVARELMQRVNGANGLKVVATSTPSATKVQWSWPPVSPRVAV
jgi:hypothetical protein